MALARKHLLAISGSLRKGSYNSMLLRASTALTPAEIAVEVYEGLAAFPLFDEDVEARSNGVPPVMALRVAVRAADGLLISMPEYKQAKSVLRKNADDWLSR